MLKTGRAVLITWQVELTPPPPTSPSEINIHYITTLHQHTNMACLPYYCSPPILLLSECRWEKIGDQFHTWKVFPLTAIK